MSGQRLEMTVDLRTTGAEASAERLGAALDGALGVKESRRELADVQKQIEGIAAEIERGGGRGARALGEQLREAIEGARKAVGQLDADNQAMSDRLLEKLKEAKAARQTAWETRDDAGFGKAGQMVAAIESERRARASLNEELSKQQQALTSLTAELDKATGAETETAAGSGSLRKELMQITLGLAEMERAGQRGSAAYEALRQRGAELVDSLGDARAQMRILAHDNSGLQGVISGVQGLSGAMTAAVGVTALFGQQSENLQKVMVKLQAVMSISMGLQQTLNALNKDSALRLGVIGRLTEWWAACKAKAAAATTAETTAVITNTGAQAAQNTVVEAGTVANAAHAFSWKAVGIAIKSVPVFGWIITGITALIGVISIFTRKTEEEIEAEKRLQKQQEEHRQRMENYRSTYASTAADLITKYKELRVAWNKLSREHERQKWIKENSSKFKDLGKNVSSVKDAEDFLVANTNKVVQALKARAMAMAAQEMQKKAHEKYLNRLLEIDTTVAGGGFYYKVSEKDKHFAVPGRSSNPEKYLPKEWDGLIEGKDYVKTYYDNGSESRGHAFDLTASGVDKINANRNKKAVQLLNQNKAEAEKEWKKVEQWTDNKIKEQQAIIDNAELDFDHNYGGGGGNNGNNNSPDPNAVQKAQIALTEAEIKAVRERNRQIQTLAFEREQALINIEKDGFKRRQMQRDLDQRMEDTQLQQHLEDQIQAEIDRARTLFEARERANKAAAEGKGKTYTEKQFNVGGLYNSHIVVGMSSEEASGIDTGDVDSSRIQSIIEYYNLMGVISKKAQQQKIEAEREADQLAMTEYLKDYGTYEEKKLAIARIYADQRAKAESDAERMRLEQEERKEVGNVDFEDFMSNRAALAFGEIDKLSRETIARLIEEMEKYRDKVTQTFDPEKIEKYNQALTKLRKAQAQSQGGLFGGMLRPEWFRERAAAQAELNEAERTHGDLVKQVWLARLKEYSLVAKLINAVKRLTGEELTSGQVMDGSTVSGIIERLLGEGNTAGAEQLRGLLDALGKARVELGAAEGAADKAALSVEKLKEGFAAKFTGKNGALGMVGAIVKGIDQAVQAANETIQELAGTADALGADTSEGSGWDKATTLMEGFAGASAGAKEAFESLIALNPMGVISGLTKSFTSWIKAFAKLHDNSLERKIKQLEDQIKEIERMNKRLDHRSEGEYSRKRAATYEEEARNLEKQRQLIEKQMMAEREKKDPDKERLKGWEDELEELGWEIEELRDKALDAILGEDISATIDNFADKLSEAWGRTGDRARATKDLVRTMLRQMVQEAMKTDLTEPIRKLREMMAAALDDGMVSSAEERELEQFAQALAEETERKYRWADRIMGNETASQSGATSGSYATASQESVDEVRGRLAAIHTSGELRRRELQGLRLDIGALMEQRERSGAELADMRGLLFMAAGYLERIARNTDRLEEMNDRLEKIERNTKRI